MTIRSILVGVWTLQAPAWADVPHGIDTSTDDEAEGPCTAPCTDLLLGPRWALVRLRPGQSLHLQLVDAVGEATRFRAHGGPPGLTISPDGRVRYTADTNHRGTWHSSIEIIDGDTVRWSGLVIHVEPTTPPPRPASVVPPPRSRPACVVELGLIGGLSANPGRSWTDVGLPDVVLTHGPFFGASCAGRGAVRPFYGLDAAPTFYYLAPAGPLRHLLAGTLGLEVHSPRVRVGPYLNAGLVTLAVGVRAIVLPVQTTAAGHGVTLRVEWVPGLRAGGAVVGYAWSFGPG